MTPPFRSIGETWIDPDCAIVARPLQRRRAAVRGLDKIPYDVAAQGHGQRNLRGLASSTGR